MTYAVIFRRAWGSERPRTSAGVAVPDRNGGPGGTITDLGLGGGGLCGGRPGGRQGLGRRHRLGRRHGLGRRGRARTAAWRETGRWGYAVIFRRAWGSERPRTSAGVAVPDRNGGPGGTITDLGLGGGGLCGGRPGGRQGLGRRHRLGRRHGLGRRGRARTAAWRETGRWGYAVIFRRAWGSERPRTSAGVAVPDRNGGPGGTITDLGLGGGGLCGGRPGGRQGLGRRHRLGRRHGLGRRGRARTAAWRETGRWGYAVIFRRAWGSERPRTSAGVAVPDRNGGPGGTITDLGLGGGGLCGGRPGGRQGLGRRHRLGRRHGLGRRGRARTAAWRETGRWGYAVIFRRAWGSERPRTSAGVAVPDRNGGPGGTITDLGLGGGGLCGGRPGGRQGLGRRHRLGRRHGLGRRGRARTAAWRETGRWGYAVIFRRAWGSERPRTSAGVAVPDRNGGPGGTITDLGLGGGGLCGGRPGGRQGLGRRHRLGRRHGLGRRGRARTAAWRETGRWGYAVIFRRAWGSERPRTSAGVAVPDRNGGPGGTITDLGLGGGGLCGGRPGGRQGLGRRHRLGRRHGLGRRGRARTAAWRETGRWGYAVIFRRAWGSERPRTSAGVAVPDRNGGPGGRLPIARWHFVIRPKLEVADIFRSHGEAWRVANAGHINRIQFRVMRAIEICRTAALGGHVESCKDCKHTRVAFNSCRNRHCPKCQWSSARRWLAAREAELLPAPYFHFVFTIPDVIARIAYQNKAEVYGLVLKAAAETLNIVAADQKHLGAELGVVTVLHTWGKNLYHHPHAHCIVPGGGISTDGKHWIPAKRRFLPVGLLSRVFRQLMLHGLDALFAAGELHFFNSLTGLKNPQAFNAALASLRTVEWVAYAKKSFPGPQQVLAYLARYTHRVAIANNRLQDLDPTHVSFLSEVYRKTGGYRRKVIRIAIPEFIRRFLLHVLPNGFHRIRYYGFFANVHRSEKIALCRRLLNVLGPSDDRHDNDNTQPKTKAEPPFCPRCGGRMNIIKNFEGPLSRPYPVRRLDSL